MKGEVTPRVNTYELPRNKEGNAIHGLVMDKEWTVG